MEKLEGTILVPHAIYCDSVKKSQKKCVYERVGKKEKKMKRMDFGFLINASDLLWWSLYSFPGFLKVLTYS